MDKNVLSYRMPSKSVIEPQKNLKLLPSQADQGVLNKLTDICTKSLTARNTRNLSSSKPIALPLILAQKKQLQRPDYKSNELLQ